MKSCGIIPENFDRWWNELFKLEKLKKWEKVIHTLEMLAVFITL